MTNLRKILEETREGKCVSCNDCNIDFNISIEQAEQKIKELMLGEEEINHIIGQTDLYHLAKSWCEHQKNFPYGQSHQAKTHLAQAIHSAMIKKLEEK